MRSIKPSYRRQRSPSSWRRLALAIWRTPNDSSCYGLIDVDVTEALELIDRVREETDVKVTLTHLVTKSLAMALAEHPNANGSIIGRRVYLRDEVDIFCQVSSSDGLELSGVKIRGADERSVVDIAEELARRAGRVRSHQDQDVNKTKASLDRVPDWILAPILRITDFLTYRMGLDLRRAGVAYDQFGSAMVSSVGSVDSGLRMAFSALLPVSHCPIVLLVNNVQKRPAVVGNEVAARPMLSLGATFDHRLIDGVIGARIAASIHHRLTHALEHLAPTTKDLTAASR